MTNYNQFLISVCDVVIRDVLADTIIAYGQTEMTSSLKQAVASTEIQGGFGNKVLYNFQHDKKITSAVKDAKFEPAFLAIQSGVLIANGAQNVINRETITLDATGTGTCTLAPTGSVYVQSTIGGGILTVVPTGSSITALSLANTKVNLIYRYSNANVDTITLDAANTTRPYELTLLGKVFDRNGQNMQLEIVLYSAQGDGNFDLTFDSKSASTTDITFNALSDPTNNGAYGIIKMVPLGVTTTSLIAIAATPSAIALSTTQTTQQIQTYGIRGAGYENIVLANSANTYVSGTPATCTVSATGLVTRVASGISLITVTNTASGLKDFVQATSV